MEDNTLDIKQIMEEIRQRAEQIEYQEPINFEDVPIYKSNIILSDEPYDEEKLSGAQIDMAGTSTVLFYRRVTGNPIVRFFKKVIRKLLFFLIEPMSQEISFFNTASLKAVNQLAAFAHEQEAENEKKDQQIKDLEKRLAELEARLPADPAK